MRWSPTIALVAAFAGLAMTAPAAHAAELLRDGGFEGGRDSTAWAQAGSQWPRTPVCGSSGTGVPGCRDVFDYPGRASARSGQWWSLFGGSSATHQTSSIAQTVTIAPGTPATLSFWIWIGRSNAAAALNVSLGATTVFAIRGDDARYREGYAHVVVPIAGSAMTGTPQSLTFDYAGYLPPGLLGLFHPHHLINVDDVSLQVADADLGVGLASAPTSVAPGATFTTTLTVGNFGPHAAGEVWAEYPLPTGATLVGLGGDGSCSAPATTPGNVVHCDFGTLGSGASKAAAIALQAGAAGTIAQAATLSHRTGDPNGGNHVAHAAVTVAAPTPPPPVCTPARRFTVPIRRGRKGTALMIGTHRTAKAKILSARLTGPKKFRTRKLKHTRTRVTVDLRTFAAGRYVVRARVRVSRKKVLNVTRSYVSCGATKASAASGKSKAGAAKK